MRDLKRDVEKLANSDELAGVLLVHEVTEQLAREMKRKRWSVRRLAKEMGVSAAQVSKWLRARNLTLRTVARMAKALGCEVEVAIKPPQTEAEGEDVAEGIMWLDSDAFESIAPPRHRDEMEAIAA